MSGVDLQAIYNRLNAVPRYHPMSANTFADWAMEAGDIVTVSRGGTSYQSPVGTSTLKWNGKQQVQISSEGSKERDAISRISARKYAKGGGGGSGMRGTQELYWEMFSEDGIMHSSIEATASLLETLVENTASGLYSRITQTDTYLRSEIANTACGLYSRIEQTASSLHSEIVDTACGLYSRIEQTASSLHSEIVDTASGLSSRIDQTASQIALKVSKGDVATQLSLECGNVTVSGGNLIVDGLVTANSVQSAIANIAALSVTAINATGTIKTTSGIETPDVNLTGSNSGALSNAVQSISDGYEENGKIVLEYFRFNGQNGRATFSIADTNTYRDAVSAARSAGYVAGEPKDASIGSKIQGSRWYVNVVRKDDTTRLLEIDLSSVYTDARSGYTQGTFTLTTVTPQGQGVNIREIGTPVYFKAVTKYDIGTGITISGRQSATHVTGHERGSARYFKSHSKTETPTGTWYSAPQTSVPSGGYAGPYYTDGGDYDYYTVTSSGSYYKGSSSGTSYYTVSGDTYYEQVSSGGSGISTYYNAKTGVDYYLPAAPITDRYYIKS